MTGLVTLQVCQRQCEFGACVGIQFVLDADHSIGTCHVYRESTDALHTISAIPSNRSTESYVYSASAAGSFHCTHAAVDKTPEAEYNCTLLHSTAEDKPSDCDGLHPDAAAVVWRMTDDDALDVAPSCTLNVLCKARLPGDGGFRSCAYESKEIPNRGGNNATGDGMWIATQNLDSTLCA